MMRHDDLIGRHTPNGGEGITAEDLYQLLKTIPYRARNNYLMVEGVDVTGLSIGQSDQAEKWEFKLRLITDREF